MPSEKIKNILKSLPDRPGVYQHLDKEGAILYVGKALNLRKRVSSYFTKNHDNGKTAVLVRKIEDVKVIVTETEIDALLLENNLIKEYQPRYNINLKDDKTYPWICIKKERFPRIFSLRNLPKDNSEYYGPYASVRVMKTVLDLIRQIYPLRNCNFQLSEDNIDAGKFKVCLEYHLKNCLGPCEGLQNEEEYNKNIAEARNIIKGNISGVKKLLKEKMKEAAAEMQFEIAQKYKEKIELVERYQSRSTVVSQSISNVDVFSAFSDAEFGYINYLKIIEGAVVQSHTLEVKKKLEETDAELIETAIPFFRDLYKSKTQDIVVSEHINFVQPDVKVLVPQRGDKKSLIDLSLKNARYYRLERLKNVQIVDPDRHAKRIMQQMKIDLRMPVEPRHLECFDNSNIQGTHPVAACVVFKNGKPSKKEYRNFNIKTVEGPDDFASMEEVIHRRYKRLLEEGENLPQLIVVDGGKGQLSSALVALDRLGLRGKISIIGIAKRLEEIYFPNDPIPMYLDKRSETLKVIQNARNEAHRFGITHHRNKRSKSGIKSELESIVGVGPSTIKLLLNRLKSVKAIKSASIETLTSVIGQSKAKKVHSHFQKTARVEN
jgi:excinuclease ABC subunit C